MLQRHNKQIRYITYVEKEHNNEIFEERGHPAVIELNVNLNYYIEIFYTKNC